ncbi:uncharacterized protein EV154DRAFT_477467 [Mucor mucedo]|uniref:uncharacterized protein n=1 Tax=Mucor mucedo TaxID=29922 RepID=UPI0022201AFB|nr:uncharacterized protein EV154DRAFT_477467 [Mucor mucedo]KAI7895335.1 hypothetical protein EV154DRAFT_477467 [Mucor mucedo]
MSFIDVSSTDADIFYDVDSGDNIWDLWYRFLTECKAGQAMHKSSHLLGKYFCIFLPQQKVKQMFEQVKLMAFVSKALKLLLNIPVDVEKQVWLKKSKTIYSNYNAYGGHTVVIDGHLVELSLLEVTGSFGSSSVARNAKDHIKGGFSTLAVVRLLQCGSLDIFVKFGSSLFKPLIGLERSLRLIQELNSQYKEVKLLFAKRVSSPASATGIVRCLGKGCIHKVEGDCIPVYKELEVKTSS